MGTGLLSQATWAIHTILDNSSGAPKVQDSAVMMFPQRAAGPAGQPGSTNFFDPLEGRILYFMVEVFSNTDNIGFDVELRRNAVSSSAKIEFGPQET